MAHGDKTQLPGPPGFSHDALDGGAFVDGLANAYRLAELEPPAGPKARGNATGGRNSPRAAWPSRANSRSGAASRKNSQCQAWGSGSPGCGVAPGRSRVACICATGCGWMTLVTERCLPTQRRNTSGSRVASVWRRVFIGNRSFIPVRSSSVSSSTRGLSPGRHSSSPCVRRRGRWSDR